MFWGLLVTSGELREERRYVHSACLPFGDLGLEHPQTDFLSGMEDLSKYL